MAVMKYAIAFGVLVLVLVAYYGATTYRKIRVSGGLVAAAKPYELVHGETTSTTTILVVGDSTGVGVGADQPEDSVAGRLAHFTHAASLENYSVSGAVVADLPAQIGRAKLKQYSIILVQIGGNDIIRFHDIAKTARQLDAALARLPNATRVLVMSAGNVGATSLFPWFLRPWYTSRTLQLHAAFTKVTAARQATYINLYRDPAVDPFSLQPEVYLSADGLHPSSKGYGLWFADVSAAI